MRRADELVEQKNHEGLKDLIKLVLRPIQSKHLLDAYIKDDHQSIGKLSVRRCFGFNSALKVEINNKLYCDRTFDEWLWSEECFLKGEEHYPTLSLGSDITFPAPWEPSRIINNLGKIGTGSATR